MPTYEGSILYDLYGLSKPNLYDLYILYDLYDLYDLRDLYALDRDISDVWSFFNQCCFCCVLLLI